MTVTSPCGWTTCWPDRTGAYTPPDLVGTSLKGDPVKLSAFEGKAVVLSFWASWCKYCLKELPILVNIQNKVGKNRLRVIAVNTEEYEIYRKLTRHMKDMDLELAHDEDGAAQKAFGVNGIPHMVIVGRDGKIVSVHRGYDESSLPAIATDLNTAIGATPKQ